MSEKRRYIEWGVTATTLLVVVWIALMISQDSGSSEQESESTFRSRSIYSQVAWRFQGVYFPEIRTIDTLNSTESLLPLSSDNNLVIILSNASCHPCQIRELINLESIHKNNSDFRVSAIYYAAYGAEQAESDIVSMKRLTGASFPFYYSSSEELGTFMDRGGFPTVLVISNNLIVSAFVPVPEDDEFSRQFYTTVINRGGYGSTDGLSIVPLNARTMLGMEDWGISSLGGRKYSTEAFSDSIVVVNRWATWCGPCIRELPSLNRLAERLNDKGIVVVAVTDEDRETVTNYLSGKDLPGIRFVTGSHLPESPLIPVTWIVGKSGEIITSHVGARDWSSEEIVTTILAVAEGKDSF